MHIVKVNGTLCSLNRFDHRLRAMHVVSPMHGSGVIYLDKDTVKSGKFSYRHWKTGRFYSESVQLD